MRVVAFVVLSLCVSAFASVTKQCSTQSGQGYSTTAPFAASNFVTDLPNSGSFSVGPVGETFDDNGNFYVTERVTNCVTKYNSLGPFSPAGGSYNSPSGWKQCYNTQAQTGENIDGLAFSNGTLWGISYGHVYGIDTATGNLLNGGNFYYNIGVPYTWDFVADPNGALVAGGGNQLIRITGLPSSPQQELLSYSPTGGSFDGLYYVSNGDFYARIDDTVYMLPHGSPVPAAASNWHLIASAMGDGYDGIAVAADGSYMLINDNDGKVSKFSLNGTAQGVFGGYIFTGGSRGDIAKVGPDGCFYITQTDRVVRITTQPDCTCNLAAPVTSPCQSGHCGSSTVSSTCSQASATSTSNCVGLIYDSTINTC